MYVQIARFFYLIFVANTNSTYDIPDYVSDFWNKIVILGGCENWTRPPIHGTLRWHADGRWRMMEQTSKVTQRFDFCSVRMADKIYVIGGKTREGITRSVLRYDLRTYRLDGDVPDMLYPRFGGSAVVIDGKIYVFGGDTGSNDSMSQECMQSGEVFDGKTWKLIRKMNHKRLGSSAVVVDGRAVVMGGYDGKYHDSVEIYDPRSNEWSMPFPPMIQSRYAASAVLYRNQIYIMGGFENGVLKSVERFDLNTREWESMSPMKSRRSGMCAVCYHGKILVMGGCDGGQNLISCEEFDPLTETFSKASIRLQSNLALFCGHVVPDLP